MIAVEQNVPLWPKRLNGPKYQGRPIKYPLADMKVGDSFRVECPFGEEERTRTAVKGCFKRFRNHVFTTRIAEGVVRVWRVA